MFHSLLLIDASKALTGGNKAAWRGQYPPNLNATILTAVTAPTFDGVLTLFCDAKAIWR